MLGEVLKPILKAYFLLEEGYYKALDDLEEKFSVPVYDYFVDPIESKGIPSFLIALLLFLLLVGGSLLVLTAEQPPSIQVVVLGKLGVANPVPLEGATVELSDETGVLFSKKTVKGRVKFDNAPKKTLSIRAQKDGFKEQSQTFDSALKTNVRLELTCDTPTKCRAAFFESGVNPDDPLYNVSLQDPNSTDWPYGENTTGNPENWYLGPGDNQTNLTFSDPDPDSPTGRLLIIVKDINGTPLDGRAVVYDARTQGAIEYVDVVQGSGLVPNLLVGRQVYVDAFAEGFIPYFGNATVIPIRPATNRVSITLVNGSGGYVGPGNETCLLLPNWCSNSNWAGVKVIAQNGSAIAGARVNVILMGREEVLYSDYSDDRGLVALTVGNGSYFAFASATGFLSNYSAPFTVNQTAVIVLPANNGSIGTCDSLDTNPECGLGGNESRVLAHAVEESGANASYSDMVLKAKTYFGAWYVSDQKTASGTGEALFSGMLVGTVVNVTASTYDQSGSANATLVQGVNRLQLHLSKRPFQVRAFAYDPLSRQYVANASFQSFVGSRNVGACLGNGCMLTMVSGEDVGVTVSAEGYVGTPDMFNLYEGIERNVTLYLVNSSALNDTFIQWIGLFNERNQLAGVPLKPGHSYLARVKVFSKDAQQTGVVMNTQNDDVTITGVDPAGFDTKGSYADSCYASPVNFANSQNAWVDVRYNGATNGSVTFNVTLDSQMALEPRTKTKTLSLAYRSYIVRGTDYLRNPYDPSLTTRPGQTHPSGCPARAYAQNFTVKSTGTTCNGQACLTLRFAQGEAEGTDSIDVRNQILVDNATRLEPFYVYYSLELFTAPNSSARLSFGAPSENLVLFNASTPFIGPSTLGTGMMCDLRRGVPFAVWKSSFSLNLSELGRCTNFGLPLRMDGVAKGRVLQNGTANLSLTLSGFNSTLMHSGLVQVDGYGVAANDFAIVESVLGQGENQLSDEATFSALSTGNCTSSHILEGKCDVGFVNATYRITALTGGTLSPKVQASAPLQLYDVQPTASVPVLNIGQSMTGLARFLVPVTSGSSRISITRDLPGQSTSLSRAVSIGGSDISFNGSDPFPPGWDTCNGYIGIKYNVSANPPFTLGKGCTDLAFRVSPIFPADATILNISIPDYGQVLTRASLSDGSHTCYEICETDQTGAIFGCDALGKTLYGGQQYFLRYSPELRSTCPQKFKVNGNSIARSQITLEFGFTGDQTVRRNVTLHVLNDVSDSSIYLSPVYTMYSSIGRLYPQLWAVTNLKQLGPRTIVFKQPSNFALKFDGPGTQVVAINPNGGNIQAFDGMDLDHPILDLGVASGSPVAPISRYSLALAAIYQSIDLNIPGFQDYTRALANTLSASQSENTFLDTGAAIALSGSVPALANRTAYWRSSAVTRYCEQTQQCLSSLYTLPGCCRESIDAWKNNTVQMDFRQDSCTFCNNTYNPSCTNTTQQHTVKYGACTYESTSHVYQCDQRCTLKSALPVAYQDAANQIGLTGTGVTVLNYGDVLSGRKCEVQFSSLNAFQSAGNQFTYYNPATPLTSITSVEFSLCQSNGACPLVVEPVNTFMGSSATSPDCALDANNDGLWQSTESLSNATYVPAVTCGNGLGGGSFGCTPAPAKYACPTGQIMAVSEALFFSPGDVNGNLIPRTIATPADIQRCRNGMCPLLLNPASDPLYPNMPTCVTGPTDNGFINANTAGASTIIPATPNPFAPGSYTCSSGFLAVAKYCFSSCENYCNQPNCNPSPLCLASGASYVPTGTTNTIFNNWVNTTPVVPVRMDTVFLGHGKSFSPASLFSDAYQESADQYQSSANGKPVFAASYIVNSKNAAGALDSMPRMLSVDGCGGSDYPYDQTLFPQQGVHLIRDYSSMDAQGVVWTSTAKAVDLPITNYIGARSDLCRKGTQWNTRLCETTFVDHSSQYGSCFNSILQYSGGPKRPGVEMSLLGGLGSGIKQGTGYGVTPDGHLFALVEPGTGGDYCGNQFPQGVPARDEKHKYHVDVQTLHHWDPLGHYTGQKDFNWVKDLGCSKDCGCKKGGGYGLLQILLPLLLMALAFFVIGPAIATAFTTTTATVSIGGTVIGSGSTIAAASTQALATLAAPALTPLVGAITVATVSTTSALAGIVTGIVTAGLSAATSGMMGASSPAITAVNLASNVITSISIGDLGGCLSWSFGTATAFACKGALWTIAGG
ncbi:hypothetical protein HY994_01110 [Candidatus Micrarchaeota archaeon]|nr:hypothetical protein [Candidatus Micrarchaeota archaeon]